MPLQVTREVKIRAAVPGEEARLSDLARRSKSFWGYDEAFMNACVAELTVERAAIVNGNVWVLELEAEPVGFYLLEPLAAARMELGMLFVAPSHIGCGFGRALMEEAKCQARAAGATVLIIQSDPHAARFYERAGARLVGEQPSASIAGRMLPLYELALTP